MITASHLQKLDLLGLVQPADDAAEDEYLFSHTLVQEAVYHSLLHNDRKELHRAVGEVLEEELGDEAEKRAAVLAYHFFQAEEYVKAVKYYRMAGEAAMRRYAMPEALDMIERALQIALDTGQVSPALYRACGLVHETLGSFEAAARQYEEALVHARPNGDRQAEWQALLDLGMLWASRSYSVTGRYFREALELAQKMEQPEILAYSLNRVGNWHTNVDRPYEARTYHLKALEIFESLNDRCGLAETLDFLGVSYLLGADFDQSTQYYRRAIDLFRQVDDRKSLVSALATSVMLSPGFVTGTILSPEGVRLPQLRQVAEEAVELAHQISWRSGEAYSLFTLGYAYEAEGNLGEALKYAHQALNIAEQISHHQWICSTSALLGVIYTTLCDLGQSLKYLRSGFELAQEVGSIHWTRTIGGLYALALMDDQRLEEAEAILDRALDPDTPAQTLGQRTAWYARAELALRRGDHHTALQRAERLESDLIYRQPGRMPIRLSLMRGKVLTALGDWSGAEASLLAGAQEARTHVAHFVLRECLGELARLYRASGRPEEAERYLKEYLALSREMAQSIEDPDLRDGFVERSAARIRSPHPPLTSGGNVAAGS